MVIQLFKLFSYFHGLHYANQTVYVAGPLHHQKYAYAPTVTTFIKPIIAINWGQLLQKKKLAQCLVYTFCILCPSQDFYPIGKRCNYTFCVTTSTMVSTYGTTVKMLQNSVHRGLILQKVSINAKHDYKTVTKNTTHMVLSPCN